MKIEECELIEDAYLKLIILEIAKNHFKRAKELGSLPQFRSSVQIQKKMIEIALIQKDYETAKEIAEREEFIGNEIIQSQRIEIAILEGKTEEGKEIGKRFKNDSVIQSQMLKIAFIEGDNNTIAEIANNVLFKKDSNVQGQLINIAIENQDFDKAKEIGQREEFENDSYIQTQMLKIARELGDIDWANRIADNPAFKSRSSIQYNRILIQIDIAKELYKKREFQKAKEMLESASINCENEEIQSDDRIQLLKNKIGFLLPQVKEKAKKQFLDKICTKLYYRAIGKEEIDEVKRNTLLSEYERMLALFAIYEKQGIRVTLMKLIRQIKTRNKGNFDEKQNDILNHLVQKAQDKRTKPFDFGLYDELLHWRLDNNIAKEMNSESNKKGGLLNVVAKESLGQTPDDGENR